MPNPFKNFAVTLVILLTIAIFGAIVWYKTLDDTIKYDIPITQYSQSKEVKASKTKDYLKNMENYEDEDVDVSKVNKKNVNAVKLKSRRDDLQIEKVLKKPTKKEKTYSSGTSTNQADFINNISSALDDVIDE